jgi:hypothetical protein
MRGGRLVVGSHEGPICIGHLRGLKKRKQGTIEYR